MALREAFYSDTISSIRAPLVLMVLVMHVLLTYSYSTLYEIGVMISMVGRGDVAVGGFFILSAFLLTRKWFSRSTSPLSMILERAARLLIPFFVAYALIYYVFALEAGSFGVHSSSMGYSWGFIVPIGMLPSLGWSDVWESLKGQLTGVNDNLILTAWTMLYELKIIGCLICAIVITRFLILLNPFHSKQAEWVGLCVFSVCWAIAAKFSGNTNGIIEAAALGSVMGFISSNPIWSSSIYRMARKYWKVLVVAWLPLFVVALSLVTVRLAASNSFFVELGGMWRNSYLGMGVLYVLLDQRYLMYAMLVVMTAPLFILLSKLAFVRLAARYISLSAYSTYLIHTHVIMLHSKLLSLLPMTLPLPVVIATFVAMLVPCVAVFYFLVERPCWQLGKWVEGKLEGEIRAVE